ncbi:hypothetical protein GPECTOR_9g726 [Gonium pectorale]|uniref:Uncharacterized protein n=1 Tax=Gonium pectorale TaxID=33097 RepID=A0A150GTK1_GONPE|nr:hypothetical protein GPECTOR_9g726 [Gonium pectorale]|eukprot:KXZ52680.1 hypothetical protein GPECTOR_9g726 [Gonium pectorale]
MGLARVFPNLKDLSLTGSWVLSPGGGGGDGDGGSGQILGAPAGSPPQPSCSAAARFLFALAPPHLPLLRSLCIPGAALASAPGLSQLSGLRDLTLLAASQLQADPLPPDLHHLAHLSSLTLSSGASDPAAWAPRLMALPRLSRLRLRKHTVSLPLPRPPPWDGPGLGGGLNGFDRLRYVYEMCVLDSLDLDLERRTLELDASLGVRQLASCVRRCESILASRAAAAAAGERLAAWAPAAMSATARTSDRPDMSGDGNGSGDGDGNGDGRACRLAEVRLTHLDVYRHFADDLAFLQNRFAAELPPPPAPPPQPPQPPAAATSVDVTAARAGRLRAVRITVSWFEAAASLLPVLGLTGAAARRLELWCGWDSPQLLRQRLRDLAEVPPGVVLPRSVVLVTREGLDEAQLRQALRGMPALEGIVTARRAGAGDGGGDGRGACGRNAAGSENVEWQ